MVMETIPQWPEYQVFVTNHDMADEPTLIAETRHEDHTHGARTALDRSKALLIHGYVEDVTARMIRSLRTEVESCCRCWNGSGR